MSVHGSLRTMPVEDLLDWIDRRFACGRLQLERGSIVRTFQFDSGYVTGASSNDPAEHLGQFLIRRGLVTPEALKNAFEVQAQTGVMLGKILLMTEALAEDDLRQALEDKIREALFDAFCWTEGSFTFELEESRDALEYEISVNLRGCIDDGQQRAAELREIRQLIPSDDAVLFVREVEAAGKAPPTELTRLLEAVGRGLTVNQIILEHAGERFRVLSRLAELVERGAIAVDRRAEPRAEGGPGSVAELEKAARGRAAGGDRTGALELAREALELAPDDPAVQKLHRELERAVFAELSRDLLTRFCVPKLLKAPGELAELDLSDNERYLAGRIDGRWDILSLMRVAPLREVEVLITFKRLADRGIISL